MRVLIADDHAMFRRGLRETIGEAFPKVTFAEAKTAQETLELVRRQDWEIVILDISMPGKSGLDILKELKTAVKRVLTGGRYVSATLAEKLASDLRRGADLPVHELLSDREFQVLRMIASGKTVKEIADELSLSVKTISTYRSRILEKTGMKTTAELIRFALRSQLVD